MRSLANFAGAAVVFAAQFINPRRVVSGGPEPGERVLPSWAEFCQRHGVSVGEGRSLLEKLIAAMWPSGVVFVVAIAPVGLSEPLRLVKTACDTPTSLRF